MGVFGPNSTPSVQPTQRQVDKAQRDPERQGKEKKKKGKEEPKPPPRGDDSVQLKGSIDVATGNSKAAKKPDVKRIDFSA